MQNGLPYITMIVLLSVIFVISGLGAGYATSQETMQASDFQAVYQNKNKGSQKSFITICNGEDPFGPFICTNSFHEIADLE